MVFTLKNLINFKLRLMLKRLVIILGLIIYCLVAYPQSYRFKHITSEEGLSTNFVTSIIQDDKGFMWFGTQEGLCKYDGYQITVFKSEPDNANTLSSSNILSLYHHSDNKIYVGTQNDGICIYDPYKSSFNRIPVKGTTENTLSDFQINCFLASLDNQIWIGTSNGFNLFNPVTLKNKKYFFPMEKTVEVNAFCIHNKNLFVGTNEGLWLLNEKNELKPVEIINNTNQKVDLKKINSITEYAGSIYLATFGSGVVMVDPQTMEVVKVYRASEENKNFNYIDEIKIKDHLMYSVTRDGFVIFDLIEGISERLFKNEKDQSSLSDDYLTTVFIDGQKNIWLGTFSGGVNVSFSQTLKFPNLPRHIGEQFENAFSMCTDSNKGDIWIGGEKYLKLLNKEKLQVQDFSFLIEESNHALSVLKDNNNIWIGTWGMGLIKYDLLTKKKDKFFSDEAGGTVMSMAFDKNKVLWVGTFSDGLFLIDESKGTTKRYLVENGLPSDNIIAVYVDSKNNVWLGTSGGGVCFVKNGDIDDKKNIKVFAFSDQSNTIPSNTVYSILEDMSGNMWFGTDAGFCAYNSEKNNFIKYSEKDGLANNAVYSLLQDKIGNLWMSTNKGVTKFNPKASNINASAFRNYDQKDGLLNIEYTSGAFAKLATGEMIFGGVNGVNIFNPKNILDNFHVPPVCIVSYKRAGKDIPTDTVITYKKHIKLNWRENYFQFELAALDYNSPLKNKYIYKLEGYDNDWSTPTNIRYISYTELPGGDYVFKVKAANNDGVWNETPYSIHITVIPPFWKTTWFYILVSVLGLTAVVVFTQLRTRAIKKENKILESKVAERTQELEEKNRDITSSIEYANRIQEAILPSRNEIFSKFTDAFIFYRPKDIVSGDFYWYGYKNNTKIFAVVDCTGHGVPGAFMSMIGHNILNQTVMEKGVVDPGQIISKLHAGIQDALKQGHNEIDTNDGMDVSIISVNEETKDVFWAGALRPAIIVRASGTLEKLVGNRYSVGGAQLDEERVFTTQNLITEKGDVIYLFSDGYADQFGGDNGKKFMLKRFQDLLISIHHLEMQEQMRELEKALSEWRGPREQVDDVLVVGIRF